MKKTIILNKQKMEHFSPHILNMECLVPAHPRDSMEDLDLNSYKHATTLERCCQPPGDCTPPAVLVITFITRMAFTQYETRHLVPY